MVLEEEENVRLSPLSYHQPIGKSMAENCGDVEEQRSRG